MKHTGTWTYVGILSGALLASTICSASPAVMERFSGNVGRVRVSPGNPTEMKPWYSLAQRYVLSGNYYMNLTLTELQIDHVAYNSRCTRRNRTFMIAASFMQKIGNDLGSGRLEFPLFSADRLQMSRLAPASVGDYVLHLNNAPLQSSVLGLALSARF